MPKDYVKTEILDSIIAALNNIVMGDDNGYSNLLPAEAIREYTDRYIENYGREAASQLQLWKRTSENGANAYFSYDKRINTEVLYNEANLISYQVNIVEAKGNATSTEIVKNSVLDLTTGNLLSQNDIFEENSEAKLNSILIAQVIKDKGVTNTKELQDIGYWGIADIEGNDNFLVDKDGITYTFSPDEYSDAELGVLNIFVNYDDLMGVLKQESPISVLIHDLD